MIAEARRCVKCDGKMEEGFVLDTKCGYLESDAAPEGEIAR